MSEEFADVAWRLAGHAEAVCRYYLPAGKREGRQWRAGDVRNTPGRSLYVRLTGSNSGSGAAGRWRDSATGESGDLIDLIKASQRLPNLAEALNEARRFLALPQRKPGITKSVRNPSIGPYNAMTSVQRLLAESVPINNTLAQAYLRHRKIDHYTDLDPLRFHPCCPYRDPDTGHFATWPAMLALVTDLDGALTGVQRTYLSPNGEGKAHLVAPRRSLGAIQRHGVRFGALSDVVAFGEGVETVLSLRCALPAIPTVATLSADNLGAIAFPKRLRRIFIAVDRDTAGLRGAKSLLARAHRVGIAVRLLMPIGDDFNADLTELGVDALRHHLSSQIFAQDLTTLVNSSADAIGCGREVPHLDAFA